MNSKQAIFCIKEKKSLSSATQCESFEISCIDNVALRLRCVPNGRPLVELR